MTSRSNPWAACKTADLVALAQASAESSLPTHDFGPGAFVQEVVDRYHALYRVRGCVLVAFAEHCVVHLLGRGVLPERTVAFGDRGGFAGERQGLALVFGAFVGEVKGHVV